MSQESIPMLILQNNIGDRVLPLPMGPFEASSVIVELEGARPNTPLTFDIFSDFLNKHGFQAKELYITQDFHNDYKAVLSYKKGWKTHTMDLRPSDGVALAVRQKAKIYAPDKLLMNIYPNSWAEEDADWEWRALEENISSERDFPII